MLTTDIDCSSSNKVGIFFFPLHDYKSNTNVCFLTNKGNNSGNFTFDKKLMVNTVPLRTVVAKVGGTALLPQSVLKPCKRAIGFRSL